MDQRIHCEKLRPLSALFAVLAILFVSSLSALPQAHASEVIESGTWGGASYVVYDDYTLAIEDGAIIENPGAFNSPLVGLIEKVKGKDIVLKGSMESMFWGMSRLTDINDLATWDTSDVTRMHSMFSWTTSLSDISALAGWDTGKVKSMTLMFNTAVSLKDVSALSGWDTSSLIFMQFMFQDCSSLTSVDFSGWDTSNVQNMGSMFYGCSSLTSVDVSGWDTRNSIDDFEKLSFVDSPKLSLLSVGENTRLADESLHVDLVSRMWHNKTKGVFATGSDMVALINAGNGAGTWTQLPEQVDTPDDHTQFLEVSDTVTVGEEVTLAEPSEVTGFTDRHLVKSPANGEVRLASIHYTAKQVGADTFEVAYWMGVLAGSPDYIVTYKVEVTAKPNSGDDTNTMGDTSDAKKDTASAVVTRPLSSTGSEVGSPIALAVFLLGLGALLACCSRVLKR